MAETPNSIKTSSPSIRGWLLVYLILAVIVDLASIVLLLMDKISGSVNEQRMFLFLFACAWIMTIYLIYAFVNRKPSAAFIGKHHVIINAVPWLCVLSAVQYYLERIGFAPFWLIIIILLLFVACEIGWRYGFNRSKQVKALIPPRQRKVTTWEKAIVILMYVAIIVCGCWERGLDKWWITAGGAIGIFSLSPLFDMPEETDDSVESDS